VTQAAEPAGTGIRAAAWVEDVINGVYAFRCGADELSIMSSSDRKPLVVIISYFFDPATAIGAVRPWRFSKYLREFGYDCRVVTALAGRGAPSDGVIAVPDAISELWQRRIDAKRRGMRMERLPFAAQVDRVVRKFLLPNQAGLIWSREAARAAARLIEGRPAVVISTYPHIGTHLAAYILKRRRLANWIADFRDPIAACGAARAFPLLGRKGLQAGERAVLHAADLVIANTEPMGAEWRKNRRLAGKIHVIWNGFDPDTQPRALPIPSRGYKHIVHAGTLYSGRNANAIIASLTRLLASAERPGVPPVKVLQLGQIDASAGVDHTLYRLGIEQGWLEIAPPVGKQEAMRTTCQADGLLLLQPQSAVQVPGKLFEYISIGRPILALAPRESAIEWILSRSGVPYACVYPDDAAEAADAKLRAFLALPNTPVPASDWYRYEFDARRQTAQLAELIEQTARASNRNPH
jgi:hypothetical protein